MNSELVRKTALPGARPDRQVPGQPTQSKWLALAQPLLQGKCGQRRTRNNIGGRRRAEWRIANAHRDPSHGRGLAPRPFYRQLYFQVLAAIILGVTVGHFWPETGASLKPLGDAFVKLVKMIIAPGDLPDRRHRHRRHERPEEGRPGRRQGDALLRHLLDARARRRPGRGQRRPARRRAQHRSGHARRAAVAGYASKAHDTTIVGFLQRHHPDDGRRAPSPTATSSRCCSSRCCSASRWRRSASAARRC